TADHMIPAGPGRLAYMYGGVITGMSVPVHDNAGATSADDYASVTITYSVSSLPGKIELLLGGHLAIGVDPVRGWGAGYGSGNINGGPYHFKWEIVDGGPVGGRDNQIQGSAIVAPDTPTPTSTVTPTFSSTSTSTPTN